MFCWRCQITWRRYSRSSLTYKFSLKTQNPRTTTLNSNQILTSCSFLKFKPIKLKTTLDPCRLLQKSNHIAMNCLRGNLIGWWRNKGTRSNRVISQISNILNIVNSFKSRWTGPNRPTGWSLNWNVDWWWCAHDKDLVANRTVLHLITTIVTLKSTSLRGWWVNGSSWLKRAWKVARAGGF